MERPEGPPPMPESGLLEPFLRAARPNAVMALRASPWAPLVAIGGYKQIALYNTDTLDLVDIRDFEEGLPYEAGFSGNATVELRGGDRAYLADISQRVDRLLGLA